MTVLRQQSVVDLTTAVIRPYATVILTNTLSIRTSSARNYLSLKHSASKDNLTTLMSTITYNYCKHIPAITHSNKMLMPKLNIQPQYPCQLSNTASMFRPITEPLTPDSWFRKKTKLLPPNSKISTLTKFTKQQRRHSLRN